jgi:hypothetical protein
MPFLTHNMVRPPKDLFATDFRVCREKSVAPHYLAEPYSPALKPDSESEAFFCHISWRQTHGGHTRAKRVKKATPRYVAGLLAPLCCVYCDFGGIRAILSGGNPPGFKTNHNEGNRSAYNAQTSHSSYGLTITSGPHLASLFWRYDR